MKKILIIGGAGFIGFNIAKQLSRNADSKITIADNFFRSGGKIDNDLQQLISLSNIEVNEGDFSEKGAFKNLDNDYDYVYMLASVVGVDYVNNMPEEIIRINSLIILNTLEWLKISKCKKVLFSSTSECYAGTVETFNYKIPTNEDVPLTIKDIKHPRFTYAITKMLGESGFIHYSSKYGFECTIVRYHNVYGPRMGFKHVIPHLVQRFMNKESPFKIFGHDQTRAFNFIDDAVEGTILAMENGKNREIYHIGTEEEVTIEKLVKNTGKLFNYDGKYQNAPTYPGSVKRRCPDISKSKTELNYEPKTSLIEGLKKTVLWYVDYINNNELHESYYDK